MTSIGAGGDTAKQMSEALHWEAMPSTKMQDQQRHFLNAFQDIERPGERNIFCKKV